jgi:hypothetical protein
MRIKRISRLLATVITIAALSSVSSSGATGNKGTVTGNLRTFGGVAFSPRSGWPTAGRVEFKPDQGTARAIKVGKTGRFTVELRPGSYTIFGGPPAWHNSCTVNSDRPIDVNAGQRLKVTVSCIAI